MDPVERTRETVESQLSVLEEHYRTFPINQTTISVSRERYEREQERAQQEQVWVYTRVHNEDDDVLHVADGDSFSLPSTTVELSSLETTARELVEARTGIECQLNGIEQATILGIQQAEADDQDTIYRLAVVFDAAHESGTVQEEAVWRAETDNLLTIA